MSAHPSDMFDSYDRSAAPARLIDFDIVCAKCGTSLRGLELGGTCRTCDAPIERTLATSAIDAETMTVSRSVQCVGCGYDLRTLRVDGVCSECGRPVGESLRPGGMRFLEPAALKGLRHSFGMLLAAGVGVPLMIAAQTATVSWSPAAGKVFAAIVIPTFLAIGFGVSLLIVDVVSVGLAGGLKDWAALPAFLSPLTMLIVIALLPIVYIGGVSASWLLSMCVWGSLTSFAVCLRRIARQSFHEWLDRLTSAGVLMLVAGAVLLVAGYAIERGPRGPNLVLILPGCAVLGGAYLLWLAVFYLFRRMAGRLLDQVARLDADGESQASAPLQSRVGV